MRRNLRLRLLFSMMALLVGIQLVPSGVINPASKGEVSAPPEIHDTLRRSCYDCHSNQTQWPWYAHVAPFSWAVARDIELGRRQLNFSEWGDYYPVTRKRKLQWMGRALQQGVMPPLSYQLIHPASRLSRQDRAQLERWIDTQLVSAASSSASKAGD
ncbi:MAG TPA: heme-binding domain-containing protein [Candidatus Binataceae bacterium]|nr:heme-binding domain-containing protein [Candidatus Binataceae bacterium]